MDAGAERDVLLVGAAGPEGAWLGKGKRIMVGHAEQQADLLARLYGNPDVTSISS